MAELNRVVAHYLDGRLLKGTTSDFFPNRLSFHLQPVEGGPTTEVRCKDLKAIFFVKDYAGNAQRRDLRGFIAAPGETAQGKKMAVRFKDGELLCGYSLSYLPDREGFFMFPADSGSNNLRIYVLAAGTLAVKAGLAADVLVEKALAAREE
jgi:hypothetical protein